MTTADDRQPAPRTVGIRELKSKASEIVREVQLTGQSIDITVRGQVVARLTSAPSDPSPDADGERRTLRAWLSETETFAQEVARRWPSSISSVELIREQRREL